MTNNEMLIELSSLALAINQQTKHSTTYAYDGKRNMFEILIYANKSVTSRVVNYYLKIKLEQLAENYNECHKRLVKIIEDHYYECK